MSNEIKMTEEMRQMINEEKKLLKEKLHNLIAASDKNPQDNPLKEQLALQYMYCGEYDNDELISQFSVKLFNDLINVSYNTEFAKLKINEIKRYWLNYFNNEKKFYQNCFTKTMTLNEIISLYNDRINFWEKL